MTRAVEIPTGAWPARLSPALAAGYCGEPSVESFLRRVRSAEYPAPTVDQGKRRLWLRTDLDKAINPARSGENGGPVADVAEEL